MITVNLLPISSFKQKFKGRIFLTTLGLMLLMGVAVIFSVKSFILDDNLQKLQARSAQLQNENNQLKNQVTAADKQTELTVHKWKQLSAIMDLEERRRDQARLLAELESLVPKDSAWLISLDHKDGVVTLKGAAKDKDTISRFLESLQNAKYLDRSSVYLMEINQRMRINNILLTNFSITARSKFPEPAILDQGMDQFKLPSTAEFVKLVEGASPKLAAGLLPGDKSKPQAKPQGRTGRK